MNTMLASEAANLISGFVDVSNGKAGEAKLLRLLSLVNQFAWKNGVWEGMTAEFNVRVDPRNGELITPHGYNILLKVNLDGKPTVMRDEYFQFHLNGTGSIKECCSSNWSGNVIYLGDSPVVIQPNQDNDKTTNDCKCTRIAVSSDGNVCETAETTIQGYFPRHSISEPEKRIYTQEQTELNIKSDPCKCSALTAEKAQGIKVIDGVKYPVNGQFTVMDDLCWGRIDTISKGKTETAVDYWAVSETDAITRIARLEPFETVSNYRRYRVPEKCCELPCVHGLFKKSKPQRIVDPSQSLLIGDDEAIIALAMGMDARYYLKEAEEAIGFLTEGIRALESCVAMSEGSEVSPIEISFEGIPDPADDNAFNNY